ncbi:HipA domain-containing protein [Lachnospiraceae bacterium YH-ros2228]
MREFLNNINAHIMKEEFNIYSGSEKKKTLLMDDGQRYMLKFPDPTRERKLRLSYINNAVSEYLGCHVYQTIEIPAQNTSLGIYTTEAGKQKIACLCRDFRNDGIVLHEAEKLILSSIDSDVQNIVTPSTVKELLKKTVNDWQTAWKRYCDMTIVDSLIGNTDRHNGNWGLAEYPNHTIGMAPVFDCGSSFSPLLSDEELSEKVANREALTVKSALRDENTHKKLSFAEILNGREPEILRAERRIIPKISLRAINDVIDSIPYISERRKEFYKSLVSVRYEKLLIPALEKDLSIQKTDEYKQWNSKVIAKIFELHISALCQLPENCDTQITINHHDFVARRNGDYLFLMNNQEECNGLIRLTKTNLNICKFVQCMRNLGCPINIHDIILETRNEASNVEKSECQNVNATGTVENRVDTIPTASACDLLDEEETIDMDDIEEER